MTKPKLVFAVPGDLTTLTGGYIYDRRLMMELRSLGWSVEHIQLPGSFPDPSPEDMNEAMRQLHAVPADCPLIVDGLAFGALDRNGVADIAAPIAALIHHPLAKENGLSQERRNTLFETESQNLSHAQQVIVPSPHTAETLASDYDVPSSKITIARPGIDQPSTQPQPVSPPLILSVGIQLPRKGHDILLKALAEIVDLDWQAVIVGAPLDQDFADMLRNLVVSLELESRVRLAGQVQRAELDQLYRDASLFALATRYEGYGIVFDEALVHGLPIVSCDAGAVANTVPDRAGQLVPADEPTAFAWALRHLLSDSEARRHCAHAAKQAGLQRPGWDQTAMCVADALTRVFQEANV